MVKCIHYFRPKIGLAIFWAFFHNLIRSPWPCLQFRIDPPPFLLLSVFFRRHLLLRNFAVQLFSDGSCAIKNVKNKNISENVERTPLTILLAQRPEGHSKLYPWPPRGNLAPQGEPGPQGECSPLRSPPWVNTLYYLEECRGQTETSPPGDNFTPRGQNSPLGQSLPLGAKLSMSLCS
jgi:hypothetical protein